MSPELIELLRDALPVIGTIGGAIVGVFGTLAVTRITTHAETRRHNQRLAFELGLKEWEVYHQRSIARLDAGSAIQPPLAFAYLNLELIRLAESNAMTPDDIAAALQRSGKVAQIVRDYSREAKPEVEHRK